MITTLVSTSSRRLTKADRRPQSTSSGSHPLTCLRLAIAEDRSGRMEDGNLEAEAEAELRCPVPPLLHALCHAVLYFGITRLPSGRSRSIHFWIFSLYTSYLWSRPSQHRPTTTTIRLSGLVHLRNYGRRPIQRIRRQTAAC